MNWSPIGQPTPGNNAVIDNGGTAQVTTAATAQELFVGRTGTGALIVQPGGTLTVSNGFVGFIAGSNGTVTVTGAGSSWSIGAFVVVGGQGTGTLTILDGGVVNSGSAVIGNTPAGMAR